MELFVLVSEFPTLKLSIAVTSVAVIGPIEVMPCSKIPKSDVNVPAFTKLAYTDENCPEEVATIGLPLLIAAAIVPIFSSKPWMLLAIIVFARSVPPTDASVVMILAAARDPDIEALFAVRVPEKEALPLLSNHATV